MKIFSDYVEEGICLDPPVNDDDFFTCSSYAESVPNLDNYTNCVAELCAESYCSDFTPVTCIAAPPNGRCLTFVTIIFQI